MNKSKKYPWYDLFQGNIRDPAQFTFAYLLVTVLLIVIFLVAVFAASPHTSDNLSYEDLTPDYWQLEEDTFTLYSSESDLPYRIWDFSEVISNPDSLLAACENGERFFVGYYPFPKADTPYNRIETLASPDGAEYLTLDRFNAHFLSGMRFFYILYAIILLSWLSLILLSIHIGRNPQKYCRRVVLWFFKESHLK